MKITLHVVLEPVYVHVYRLKGSDLGFYHTGVGEIPLPSPFCHKIIITALFSQTLLTPGILQWSGVRKHPITVEQNCRHQSE